MTFAEVSEGIRATLAGIAQAQDDGRTDDFVALYTPDAVIEVPGIGALVGAEAIRQAFSQPGWTPLKPQRHFVVNIVVTDWDDQQAHATSDVVFIQKGDSGWAIQILARYYDSFQQTQGSWLISRRVDEYVDWWPPAGDT